MSTFPLRVTCGGDRFTVANDTLPALMLKALRAWFRPAVRPAVVTSLCFALAAMYSLAVTTPASAALSAALSSRVLPVIAMP